MPVYNAEKYVKTAIESILNQTEGDFEFLIFDDASADKSSFIIQSFSDSRIRYFRSDFNQGYLVYLNKGITLSQGEYIARMDADDIAEPTRFAKQLNLLERCPEIGICGSLYTPFDESGLRPTVTLPVHFQDVTTEMFFHCPIGHPTVMGRASLFKSNLYNPEYYPAEDYELWARLSTKTKLYNIPESLLHYRLHDSNISVRKAVQQRENSVLVQASLWKKKFPHLTEFEIARIFEGMLITSDNSYSLSEVLKIVHTQVLCHLNEKSYFKNMLLTRIKVFTCQRTGHLSNKEIVRSLFSFYYLSFVNFSTLEILFKTIVRNCSTQIRSFTHWK